MLDDPDKTARLLAALKSAAPFEAELIPFVAKHLQSEDVTIANERRHVVSDVSYAGDEGGVMCHIVPQGKKEGIIIISLTYVRVSRSMPFAAAVAAYQKHRIKKLKQQAGAAIAV
jgi:hypothetical protein